MSQRGKWFSERNTYADAERLVLRTLKYDLQSAQWLHKRDTCIRILDLVRPKNGMLSSVLRDVNSLREREAEELTSRISEIITPYHLPTNPDPGSHHRGARSPSGLLKTSLEASFFVPKSGGKSVGPSVMELKWIWRAHIVMAAIRLFHDMSETEFLGLQHESHWPFRPEDFYRYSRACLRLAQSAGGGKSLGLPLFARVPMAILPQEERGWFVEAADAQRRAIYSAIEAKVVKKPSEINVMT